MRNTAPRWNVQRLRMLQ